MWPSTPTQRLASAIVLLIVVYALIKNLGGATAPERQESGATPGERLEVNAVRTLETGNGARLRLAGITGSIAVKTGRPGEVLVERLPQAAPGMPEPAAAPLPLVHDSKAVTIGRPLKESGRFGILPGETHAPVTAELRLVVGHDAALELLDINGKVSVTAVQGGVVLRGGTVAADFTNLGSAGLTVDITGGSVSVDGAGGTCDLALGDAPLTATQLSCKQLTVSSRKSVHIEDGNALGTVAVTTTAGNVTVARIRAEEATVKSDTGGLAIADATIGGTLKLEATAGDVMLSRLGVETLTVGAGHGTVEVSDVRGKLDITTNQGDVTLRRVTSEALKLVSGGQVIASGALLEGPGHEIRTSGGAVTLYVPKEASLALNADAGSGAIMVDPALQAPSGRQRLTTDIHGGDVPLTIVSSGGAIRLLTGHPMFY